MIFAGDVAIANGDQFIVYGFSDELRARFWCINLEGSLTAEVAAIPTWGVYNTAACWSSFKTFKLARYSSEIITYMIFLIAFV